MIRLGEAKGFVPYAYLNPTRFPGGRVPTGDVLDAVASGIVGTRMKLRVMRVDVPARDLVLSERAILIDDAIRSVRGVDEKHPLKAYFAQSGSFLFCIPFVRISYVFELDCPSQ